MTQTETPKWQSKTTQVPWRVGVYSDIPVTKFDFYRKISHKKNLGSGKWAKVLVAKSDDLSLSPGTHMVVEENQLLQVAC